PASDVHVRGDLRRVCSVGGIKGSPELSGAKRGIGAVRQRVVRAVGIAAAMAPGEDRLFVAGARIPDPRFDSARGIVGEIIRDSRTGVVARAVEGDTLGAIDHANTQAVG